MRTNAPNKWTEKTHEGAVTARITPEQQLRRSLMTCMLWEDEFYEDGQTIADRIKTLVPLVNPAACALMAIEAREKMKLRHAPLWVAVAMAGLPTHKGHVAALVERIVQRPDELTELLSLYSLGRTDAKKLNKLSAQIRKGLARAFPKFNEYELAKWDRQGAVKLRDVLRLVHPKPIDDDRASLWKRLMNGELATPDTWEVAISAAKSPEEKRVAWERLLGENKLGALALLRNLRNMTQVNVPVQFIRDGLAQMKTDRVLPFRFISAATHAPHLEPELEAVMLRSLGNARMLPGHTILLVDVSGSMYGPKVSAKSELTRADAAEALAMLLREVCEEVAIITFSTNGVLVPPRRGFALRDVIRNSQMHGGTDTGSAVNAANQIGYDRLIVITDEQSHTQIPKPIARGYFVNVASAKNGIGYGPWVHIDGWSEAIVDYIAVHEQEGAEG